MIPVGTNLERKKLPVATLGLIAVNVAVFVIELLLPDDTLRWTFQHLGFGPATRNPLAPFTALFLHADVYHIAFNMLFLWIFGGPVEERVGAGNFLKFYFGAGVAAGLLSVLMEVIARPDSTIPGIGASGAISGIMALFLYRCFYAKLKMMISPILLPRQVSIPVIPLVLFWFFQDLIMGIFSLSVPTGIGHWAHVGGFAVGIAIGRIKRYGQEGQVEQLRGRILKKLSEGGGWKSAEKDLRQLLEKAPRDPEVHHDLARLYAENGQTGPAERHYIAAVQHYFTVQHQAAAYAVIEHETALSKPMQPQYLLKAAEALIRQNEYEDAHRVLASVPGQGNHAGQLVEKILMLFIQLSLHLNRKEEAEQVMELFAQRFPQSRHLTQLRQAMAKKPGEVFAAAAPAAGKSEAGVRSADAKEADRLGIIDVFERIFADPAFWLLLLALNIFSPFFFPRLYFSNASPLYLFVGAFVLTIVHRAGSIADLWAALNGPSEKKARQDVEHQRLFDDAVMSEKKELYPAAAGLYEKFLAQEPGNLQARFNLARLYHKRLNNAVAARRHYRFLAQHAPKDHPFMNEAENGLKELKPAGPVTS